MKEFYLLTDGVRQSDCLIDLARQQERVEFDRRFLTIKKPRLLTPIKGITWMDYKPRVETYKGDYMSYLMGAIADVLKRLHKKDVLFIHSSGYDSRILSDTMARLRDIGYDFSGVHFREWGCGETESFLTLMKRMGWTNYSVLSSEGDDPYDIGRDDISTGGWYSYTNQMNYWKGFEPKDTILLTAAMGEVVQWHFEQWFYNTTFFSTRAVVLTRLQKMFKQVVVPYMDVVNQTLEMPRELRALDKDGKDYIRAEMVRRLGLEDIPKLKPVYNWKISDKRKKRMMEQYKNSKFYKETKHDTDIFGDGAKAWGFAVTVYEKI